MSGLTTTAIGLPLAGNRDLLALGDPRQYFRKGRPTSLTVMTAIQESYIVVQHVDREWQRQRCRSEMDEAALFCLLMKGDVAGLKVIGSPFQQVERMLNDLDDARSSTTRMRIASSATATRRPGTSGRPGWRGLEYVLGLELGTCCKYPDNPLVRCAVDPRLGRPHAPPIEGGDCARTAAELARQLTCIPGLLAQIHAILPRLNRTAVAQLLCPVGRLTAPLTKRARMAAVGLRRPRHTDRRSEFAQLRSTLAECSKAIRTALGWKVAA